jgi:AcrR family transcriptional regulator
MNQPSRPYMGESAKSRVMQRRRQLMDTAYQLLRTGEWRGISISRLCQLATLNKRYFYESFPDLDAVAEALILELSNAIILLAFQTASTGRTQQISVPELAHRVMKALIEHLTDDPWRAKILFTDLTDSPSARRARRSAIQGLEAALSQYGHLHYDANQEADAIASVTSALLVGGTIEVILNWLDGVITMPREQLIEDVAAMWQANGDATAARAKARKKQT